MKPVIDQQPAPHPAITHCDNCGCDWLDNGLNPVGCPYCKQSLTGEEDAWCAECGVKLENVRPGKHQHPTCSQAQPFPTDEALLRQALEALEQIARDLPWELTGLQADTIAALRERLGEKK